jgi:hypothetical protein
LNLLFLSLHPAIMAHHDNQGLVQMPLLFVLETLRSPSMLVVLLLLLLSNLQACLLLLGCSVP